MNSICINREELLHAIILQLSHDLDVLFGAAKTAHEAATHPENAPADKYDTLALEASYVAQGQANRARQIRHSIGIYKQLSLPEARDVVQLTSLVMLEDADGVKKMLFIGPAEGGLKIEYDGMDIVVITPGSVMGRELLGMRPGDSVGIESGGYLQEYEIVEVS